MLLTIYSRLAKRLGLEKLALIALEDMEAKLNDEAVGIARFDTAGSLPSRLHSPGVLCVSRTHL